MRLRPDFLPDALGQLARARAIRSLQHQTKLLAPVAGHDVDLARARLQDGSHSPQDLVPCRVAVGVVDLLEVVDVSQQEGHVHRVSLGSAQHGGEAFLEGAMVDQASEPVGGGLLLQRLNHAAVLHARWPPGSRSRPASRAGQPETRRLAGPQR